MSLKNGRPAVLSIFQTVGGRADGGGHRPIVRLVDIYNVFLCVSEEKGLQFFVSF